MATERKRGRPAIDPALVRERHRDTRWSDAENAALERAAALVGKPVATWLHDVALAAARREIRRAERAAKAKPADPPPQPPAPQRFAPHLVRRRTP